MTGKNSPHYAVPAIRSLYIPDEQQNDDDHSYRQRTLRSVLRYAQENALGAVGLIELVDTLGLQEELEELAGHSSVRHQLIASARGLLEISAPVSDGT